jgi:hypothetical protein
MALIINAKLLLLSQVEGIRNLSILYDIYALMQPININKSIVNNIKMFGLDHRQIANTQ